MTKLSSTAKNIISTPSISKQGDGMMGIGGKEYKSEWWGKKTRKKFLMWASYFIVGMYLILLAVFIILSLLFPVASDPMHISFLRDFIFYFSSPVMLFAILLVLWSREM
jgi:hypothetical protein